MCLRWECRQLKGGQRFSAACFVTLSSCHCRTTCGASGEGPLLISFHLQPERTLGRKHKIQTQSQQKAKCAKASNVNDFRFLPMSVIHSTCFNMYMRAHKHTYTIRTHKRGITRPEQKAEVKTAVLWYSHQ